MTGNGTNTATFTFGSLVPDGRFTGTIPAGQINGTGGAASAGDRSARRSSSSAGTRTATRPSTSTTSTSSPPTSGSRHAISRRATSTTRHGEPEGLQPSRRPFRQAPSRRRRSRQRRSLVNTVTSGTAARSARLASAAPTRAATSTTTATATCSRRRPARIDHRRACHSGDFPPARAIGVVVLLYLARRRRRSAPGARAPTASPRGSRLGRSPSARSGPPSAPLTAGLRQVSFSASCLPRFRASATPATASNARSTSGTSFV